MTDIPKISDDVKAQLAATRIGIPPLLRALNDLHRAAYEHQHRRRKVGDNHATWRIVIAARALARMHQDIAADLRDAEGWPQAGGVDNWPTDVILKPRLGSL